MNQEYPKLPLHLAGKGANKRHAARQRRLDETGGLGVVHQDGVVLVPLLHRQMAKIDPEDIDKVASLYWTRNKMGYAVAHRQGGGSVWMHRVITGCPDGMEVDHINGDRSDNRKANLRICDKKQNQGNRWKSKHAKTSVYKGVVFSKKENKYVAYGREGSKNKRLGSFESEVDAALAYDRWAVVYFGEFAKLNSPVALWKPTAEEEERMAQ